MMKKLWTAIGLMSGTSMDGVDAAIITTDGENHVEFGANMTIPYDPGFRAMLRDLISGSGDAAMVEKKLTRYHARAVMDLLRSAGMSAEEIDVIGFHGHTILHNPKDGNTWQIGNGKQLSNDTGIDVVYDLRSADVAAGGQGAPLAPVFHRALSSRISKPLVVLNIGGVANLTWIGSESDDLMGFDTGPGNAMIDDWVMTHTGEPFDRGGMLAAAGQIHPAKLTKLLAHPYFSQKPPKSLDRDNFNRYAAKMLRDLSAEDGAALLTAFTVESIAQSASHLPLRPFQWIVIGGGRNNASIMDGLRKKIEAQITLDEEIGWPGDAVEALAFGYMAVRSRLGLPLSFPGTTGVPRAMSGGVFVPKP